jgi:hypothetical protein
VIIVIVNGKRGWCIHVRRRRTGSCSWWWSGRGLLLRRRQKEWFQDLPSYLFKLPVSKHLDQHLGILHKEHRTGLGDLGTTTFHVSYVVARVD